MLYECVSTRGQHSTKECGEQHTTHTSGTELCLCVYAQYSPSGPLSLLDTTARVMLLWNKFMLCVRQFERASMAVLGLFKHSHTHTHTRVQVKRKPCMCFPGEVRGDLGSAGLVTTCPLLALCWVIIAGLGFPLNFYTRSERSLLKTLWER